MSLNTLRIVFFLTMFVINWNDTHMRLFALMLIECSWLFDQPLSIDWYRLHCTQQDLSRYLEHPPVAPLVTLCCTTQQLFDTHQVCNWFKLARGMFLLLGVICYKRLAHFCFGPYDGRYKLSRTTNCSIACVNWAKQVLFQIVSMRSLQRAANTE